MKIKLPKSVHVAGPNGENIEVSAAQIIDHVVRTDRNLGQSGDVDRVRIGGRILTAVAAGSADQTAEIAPDDVEELKKALRRPSRGWAAIPVQIEIPAGPGQPPRMVTRKLVPSAVDLLPVLEGLLGA